MGIFKLIKMMFMKDKELKMKSIYDIKARVFLETLVIMFSMLIFCLFFKLRLSIYIIVNGIGIGQYFFFNNIIENNNKEYREHERLKKRKVEVVNKLRELIDLLNKNNLRNVDNEKFISKWYKYIIDAKDTYDLDLAKMHIDSFYIDILFQINKQYHEHKKEPIQYNTSDKENYLRILELPFYVEDIQMVRKKWLELVKRYHPDRCKDGEEKIKVINNAYDELKKILV